MVVVVTHAQLQLKGFLRYPLDGVIRQPLHHTLQEMDFIFFPRRVWNLRLREFGAYLGSYSQTGTLGTGVPVPWLVCLFPWEDLGPRPELHQRPSGVGGAATCGLEGVTGSSQKPRHLSSGTLRGYI